MCVNTKFKISITLFQSSQCKQIGSSNHHICPAKQKNPAALPYFPVKVSNGSNIMRDAKMYIVRNIIGMYLSRFRHFFAQTYTSSWFLAGIISTLARPLVKVEHVLSSWLKKEFESLWCFSVYREWSGMGKKIGHIFLNVLFYLFTRYFNIKSPFFFQIALFLHYNLITISRILVYTKVVARM